MLSPLLALLLAATPGPSVVVPATLEAPAVAVDPKKMSQSQIRAHNAKLQRTDPNYIRCVRTAALGSLVSRNFSCRTVAQWDAADRAGNEEMRRVQDAMSSKAVNSN